MGGPEAADPDDQASGTDVCDVAGAKSGTRPDDRNCPVSTQGKVADSSGERVTLASDERYYPTGD